MTGIVEIEAPDRITSVEKLEASTGISFRDLWNWAIDNSPGVLRTYMRNHRENVDDFWIVRELWRMRYGSRPFYADFSHVLPIPTTLLAQKLLFVHVSLKDSLKVAFTPSADYGRSDRQVVTSPGRYLTKYYAAAFTEEQIRSYTTLYRAHFGVDDVLWAASADEIEAVYLNSATTSCMTHAPDHYGTGGIHPVRAYAGPDIRVAYLEREKRVVSRTVVFETQKRWIRIFGDDLLRVKLERMGYTQDSLEGARLARIVLSPKTRLLCPYLDGNVQCVTDKGTYLKVDMNGTLGSSERGWVSASAGDGQCRDCDAECDDDELNYLEFYDESVCNSCFENYTEANYTRSAHLNFGWVHGEDVMTYEDGKGTQYYVHNQSPERTLRLMNFVILSSDHYGDDIVHDRDDIIDTSDGDIIRNEDSIETVNGGIYHVNDCTELVPGSVAWIHTCDDMTDWMIDTSSRTFVHIDEADADDLETIPVRQWIYWMLAFMPRDEVNNILRHMFPAKQMQVLLQGVMRSVLGREPLLANGPIQTNLFREAA